MTALTAVPAVVAEGLSKSYRRWGRTRAFGTLKSALLGRGLRDVLNPVDTVPALTDVSFSVRRGETFGVVGPNGCGKSTLLKLVAGILKPNAGRIAVNGKVSALIELGAGFHPEISGRENVVINGVMLGMTRKEIERKLPEIVEFSGLSEFIDQPVKTYSSGMYVRLGFAVAIHVDPDILVVDEVLAVGDEAFSHRCLDTIGEMSARGKTIFFVTHSLALVEELCDRVLYLEGGRVKGLGDPRELLAAYRLDVSAQEGERLAAEHVVDQVVLRAASAEVAPAPAPAASTEAAPDVGPGPVDPAAAGEPPAPVERARRWGDRSATITACRLLDASGAERYAFRSGESVSIEIEAAPGRPLRRLRVRHRRLHAGGPLRPRHQHRDRRLPPGALRRPGARRRQPRAVRPRRRDVPDRRRHPLAARHAVRLLARGVPVPDRLAAARRRRLPSGAPVRRRARRATPELILDPSAAGRCSPGSPTPSPSASGCRWSGSPS